MVSNEDFFKREEDRKWREQVDQRLTSLTSDTLVSQDRLDDIEQRLKQIDELLEGVPTDKLDNGLKGDLHDLSQKVNRLWAVLFMDAAGEKGLLEEWKRLRRKDDWKRELLKFWAPVVVAVISTCGLLLSEWPRLKGLLSERHEKPPAVAAKRPAKRIRRARPPAVVPDFEESDGPSDQELP